MLFMGQVTISMAMFNRYVTNKPEGKFDGYVHDVCLGDHEQLDKI